MFQVSRNAEIPILSAIAGRDHRVYSYVELAVNAYWFMVESKIKDENSDASFGSTLHTYHVEHLLQIPNIQYVNLVIPNYVNKKGRTIIEPLTEIILAAEPGDENHKAHIYVTENGNHYVHSNQEMEESRLLNKRTIFKI